MFYYVFGNNNSGGLFSFYLFISLYFGSSAWVPAACVHGDWDWAGPEGLLGECCLLCASEWTSARNSQPESSICFQSAIIIFWQCDTPTPFSLKDFFPLYQWIWSRETPIAFSISSVAHATSELFLIEPWLLAVISCHPGSQWWKETQRTLPHRDSVLWPVSPELKYKPQHEQVT